VPYQGEKIKAARGGSPGESPDGETLTSRESTTTTGEKGPGDSDPGETSAYLSAVESERKGGNSLPYFTKKKGGGKTPEDLQQGEGSHNAGQNALVDRKTFWVKKKQARS